LLLVLMSLATVCASSANACVAVFSLPPVAIIAAPVASLWAAALVAAAAVQCRVGGNRLPFRRRGPPSSSDLRRLMHLSDGSQGVLASAESLSGSVRTALGWNATGLVAVAMLLLALALPDAHATFSTPQRVLLPLSLLLNQALICVALRALAAAAGTTAKVWELDVALLAHPQGA